MIMMPADIKKMIKRHEGYRDFVYIDSVGVLTGGWGHAFHKGSHISKEVAEIFFNDDYESVIQDYNRFCNVYALELDSIRRAVIIDMIFNLGLAGLMKFKKMIAALCIDDYEEAAKQGLDSKWAGQVGDRADELMGMMYTGEVS